MYGSIDIFLLHKENLPPVPLKHHTETAYMIFLGLVICVFGFFIALLPHIPAGLPYWAIFLVLSLLYPLILAPTLRYNRADYEFRMMHWFPFFMVVLWLVLELIGPMAYILRIFQLGFFFLWSLPLVALGIFFLILFAAHVIRRRFIRIIVLSVFLALFTFGALATEAMHRNSRLTRTIYSSDLLSLDSINTYYDRVRSYLGVMTGTGDTSGVSSSSVATGSSASSTMIASSSRSLLDPSSVSSSAPALMSSSKPTSLPSSGPETAAVLIATLLALYMGTVHARAGRRV